MIISDACTIIVLLAPALALANVVIYAHKYCYSLEHHLQSNHLQSLYIYNTGTWCMRKKLCLIILRHSVTFLLKHNRKNVTVNHSCKNITVILTGIEINNTNIRIWIHDQVSSLTTFLFDTDALCK
jgi:hypothetical protein